MKWLYNIGWLLVSAIAIIFLVLWFAGFIIYELIPGIVSFAFYGLYFLALGLLYELVKFLWKIVKRTFKTIHNNQTEGK